VTALHSLVIGVASIVAAVATAAISALLLQRMQRHGNSLIEGMAQVVFLPHKRTKYLWLMSVEGALFVFSGISFGLFETDIVPGVTGTVLFAALFVSGLVVLTARSILGLLPIALTDADRATMRRNAPAVLESLAFIPLDPPETAEQAQQRLYVLAVPSGARLPTIRRRRRPQPGQATGSISRSEETSNEDPRRR
jgi:hypothetical protein